MAAQVSLWLTHQQAVGLKTPSVCGCVLLAVVRFAAVYDNVSVIIRDSFPTLIVHHSRNQFLFPELQVITAIMYHTEWLNLSY